jgi:hypothetical protein
MRRVRVILGCGEMRIFLDTEESVSDYASY